MKKKKKHVKDFHLSIATRSNILNRYTNNLQGNIYNVSKDSNYLRNCLVTQNLLIVCSCKIKC